MGADSPAEQAEWTVTEARAWISGHLTEGVNCPCCRRRVRIYRRPMTSVAARAVVALWRVHGAAFGHLPTVARDHLADVAHQGGYLVLAAHWRLIEPEIDAQPETGRAGYWRVTAAGRAWILGHFAVPRYAVLLDGRCLRLEGAPVTCDDTLGANFKRADLLGPDAMPTDDDGRLQLFCLPDARAAA